MYKIGRNLLVVLWVLQTMFRSHKAPVNKLDVFFIELIESEDLQRERTPA